MEDPVKIVDYRATWAGEFERESQALAEAVGEFVLDIQHVGSTSVPGLAAKPVIDIAVALSCYPLPDSTIRRVCALGYTHMGEFGIPSRHYFRKGKPRTHHVHMLEAGSEEWERMIVFRDYLRAHPEEAREYELLKRRLAGLHRSDRVTYTESKSPFINGLIAKARARQNRQPGE